MVETPLVIVRKPRENRPELDFRLDRQSEKADT